MYNKGQEEKRSYPRKPSHLFVRYSYGSNIFTGIALNLSKNGLFIKSVKGLPVQTRSDVLIPLVQEVLKVPINIQWMIKIDMNYSGMGVQVLNPPNEYLDFVEYFETADNNNHHHTD